MTSNRLAWQALQPDARSFQPLFSNAFNDDSSDILPELQPRLFDAANLLLHSSAPFPLMLIRCAENSENLSLLAQTLQHNRGKQNDLYGGNYLINDDKILWQSAQTAEEPFASRGEVQFADWIEPEQLFGCVHVFAQRISLQPGLIHRANGGVLLLSLRTVLAQPLMWLRLKQIVMQRRFDWLSPDRTRPLPVALPSMPMQLKLVLCGDRDALADFQEIEPELTSLAIYSEYEESLRVEDQEDMRLWCRWVAALARQAMLPLIEADFWPLLLREAARYSGDQDRLPLCPAWLGRQLHDAAHYGQRLNAEALQAALDARSWREGYFPEQVHDEILRAQIFIETEGAVIGQINGLSVIEFPGHPRAFGEPCRISCVVHVGDGDLTDVERKAELGGNIHAKGMMIMQAFLVAELGLDQQLPFSASLVFEQSYSEVDGDSASLAGLCVLISALAKQPINQQIAVTGSVDQFGHVQPVGGLNEKIEGFFRICQQRGLTGQQGVIIPAANMRHLCLRQEVVDAVRNGAFHIWAVSEIGEALPLLTGIAWRKDNAPCLLQTIQDSITEFNQQEARHRFWPLRWLHWFNHS